MARYTFPANRGVRSTTIVDLGAPAGSSPTSKAQATSARVRVTAQDVRDPNRLVKVLTDLQDSQDAQTQATRSNPFSSPCLVRGVTFAPHETKVVAHTLNRPYTDWHPTRHRGTPAQLTEVELPAGGTLSGLTADRFIVLKNGSTLGGVYNIQVIGD